MKVMKYLMLVLMMLPVWAKAQEKVIVNDKYAQQRNVGSFSEISVSGSIDLYLSPDDHQVVVVSARDEALRDRIVTRVNGNKLEISFDSKGLSMKSDMRLKAYVSFRELTDLSANGSSDIFVNGVIKSDRLNLHITGSSDFSGALDVNRLDLHQSGSSDSKISGRASMVKVHLSGASDMKAFDLNAEICNVDVSGASDVSVTVSKELYVHATGASDIRYKGGGAVKEARTSGSSSIKMIED